MKKKFVSLAVSLGILALIYWKLNKHGQLGELLHIFATSNSLWMTISLAMVVPLSASSPRGGCSSSCRARGSSASAKPTG